MLASILAGLLLCVCSALAAAPPPGSYELAYDYNGDGCLWQGTKGPATLDIKMSQDFSVPRFPMSHPQHVAKYLTQRQKITITYLTPNMTAIVGPGYNSPQTGRRYCIPRLRLKAFAGAENWQYAITSISHQARVRADQGAEARITTTSMFATYDAYYPTATTNYPPKGGKAEAGEILLDETHDLSPAPSSSCPSLNNFERWNREQFVTIYMFVYMFNRAAPIDDAVAGSVSLYGEKEGKPLVLTLGLEWSNCR